MQQIISLDQQVFLLINSLPHPGWLVGFFWFFSSFYRYFIWLFMIYWVLGKTKKINLIPLLVVAFIGSSVIANGVFKPLVGRLRPEFVLDNIKTYTSVSDYFSYISGHATTSFSLAIILSQGYPQAAWLFYLFAIIISFSRIYLGVHYPLDIIVGAFVGIMFGYFILVLPRSRMAKYLSKILPLVFFLTCFFTPKIASAETVITINQDNAILYQEEQVLGLSSDKEIAPMPTREAKKITIMENLVNITADKGKILVSTLGQNGQVALNESVDKVRLDIDKINNYLFGNNNGFLTISDNISRIKTSLPISVDRLTGVIAVETKEGNRALKYLPDEILKLFNKVGINDKDKPLDIELARDNAKIVYRTVEIKNRKLFGFIPISFNITTSISADTGQVFRKFSLPEIKFGKS